VNYCAYELLGAPACGKISKKIVIELVKIPNLQAFLEACMKVNVRLLTSTVIVSALLMMILAACAPDASQFILSPNLSKQIAARDAGAEVTVIKEEVKTLADLSEEEKFAGLPEDVMAEIGKVDPAAGEALRTKYACAGCHSIDGAVLAGPTWKNLGNTAVNRVKGESPAFYLYQSITEPDAHVVEGYPSGVMPKTFKDQMSATELAETILYIMGQTQ